MYVCLCKGVTDSQIKALVESGTRDLKSVQNNCKAGTQCGTCMCDLKKLLKETCLKLSPALPKNEQSSGNTQNGKTIRKI